MTQKLPDLIAANRSFGELICQKIIENINKLGLQAASHLGLPDYQSAVFNLVTDPYTQDHELVGYWYSPSKQRIGQIQFHTDGSFYAEYDVVQAHPSKPQFFVEAINAWGRQDAIKTEAKLLAMPQ